jgi:hypothetical protein
LEAGDATHDAVLVLVPVPTALVPAPTVSSSGADGLWVLVPTIHFQILMFSIKKKIIKNSINSKSFFLVFPFKILIFF